MIRFVSSLVLASLLGAPVARAQAGLQAPVPVPPSAAEVAAALDALAALPEFGAAEGKKNSRTLYGEIDGMQVLSLRSERETKDFLHDLQVQRFLLEQLFPEEFRAPFTTPLLFILRPPAPRGVPRIVAGPEVVGATTLGVRDSDVLVVAPSYSRNSVQVDPGIFPLAAFLHGAAISLPAWVRTDLFVLFNRYRVPANVLEVTVPPGRLGQDAWAPIADFFHRDPTRWAGGRGGEGQGPAANAPRLTVPSSRLAFARWALLGDANRRKAYWTFVRRTNAEPVTEALFQECFGVGYVELQKTLQWAPAPDGRTRPARIAASKPPEFLPVALHPVTATELARARGAWKRLLVAAPPAARFRPTAEWRRRALDEVVRDLEAAQRQDPRDPQLRVELALAQCDAGRDAEARPHLEEAVRTRLVRPRVYFELARLRYQDAKAAPAEPGGRFGAEQVAGIAELLAMARRSVPVSDKVFLLFADTLARAAALPGPEQMAILDEGLRTFPDRAELARFVAGLRGRTTLPAEEADESAALVPELFKGDTGNTIAVSFTEASLQARDAALARGRAPTPSIQLRPKAINAYQMPRTGDFVFELLPKSMQSNPLLDMTVVTRFTPYGRQIRPATPQDPAYYVLESGGFQERGETYGGQHKFPPERIAQVLKDALAANGYVSAELAHRPPSLLIVYHWGTHYRPDPEDPNFKFKMEAARERSLLVTGGLRRPTDWEKSQYLSEQAADGLYFVVASAYDYDQVAHGNRTLVWRTHMTASASGVAMAESLSPLIASAGPYLGREMTEPELTSHRISRSGRVEIGEAVVVPETPDAGKAPPTKP